MNFLNNSKVYLTAAGLLGLALYQFSVGDCAAAGGSLLAGLGMLGLKLHMNGVEAGPAPGPKE